MISARWAALPMLAAGSFLSLGIAAPDKKPAGPLLKAALAGNAADVQAALKTGIDVNAADERGNTALSIAAEGGRADALQALLAARADVNRANRNGLTPIMRAALRGHDQTV